MAIQDLLGSDIQMQLDECVRLPCSRRGRRARHAAVAALGGAVPQGLRQRAGPGRVRHRPGRRGCGACGSKAPGPWPTWSFDGNAIGGLAVGEPQDVMLAHDRDRDAASARRASRATSWASARRTISIESARRGVDMFDCVMPTRAGRHGLAYTRFGKVNLRNARHAADPRPLDETSDCPAARDYSRAYLHHLVKSGEILGMMLLTWVNLSYYQHLMSGIRKAIAERDFEAFSAATKEAWLRAN